MRISVLDKLNYLEILATLKTTCHTRKSSLYSEILRFLKNTQSSRKYSEKLNNARLHCVLSLALSISLFLYFSLSLALARSLLVGTKLLKPVLILLFLLHSLFLVSLLYPSPSPSPHSPSLDHFPFSSCTSCARFYSPHPSLPTQEPYDVIAARERIRAYEKGNGVRRCWGCGSDSEYC